MKRMPSEYHETPSPDLLTVDMGEGRTVEIHKVISEKEISLPETDAYIKYFQEIRAKKIAKLRLSRSSVGAVLDFSIAKLEHCKNEVKFRDISPGDDFGALTETRKLLEEDLGTQDSDPSQIE